LINSGSNEMLLAPADIGSNNVSPVK
jgi:hypothetical protein